MSRILKNLPLQQNRAEIDKNSPRNKYLKQKTKQNTKTKQKTKTKTKQKTKTKTKKKYLPHFFPGHCITQHQPQTAKQSCLIRTIL